MSDLRRTSANPATLVVLGMHRSGTSCVTGVLKACGISLGPEDELMPPNEHNPIGHNENLRLNRICVGLLASAHADWWKVSRFDISDLPRCAINEARAGFTKLLAELESPSALALKDPRLCLLLPVLSDLLPRPVFVHVVRSPAEVALSLNARDGTGLAEGVALWEVYNRSAIRATAGGRRLQVDYGDLVNRPEQTVADMLAGLQSFGVRDIQMPGTGALAELVRDDFYHQRDGGALLNAILTEDQKVFWHSLKSVQWPECADEDASRRHRGQLLASLERQMEMQQAEKACPGQPESTSSERGAAAAHLADKIETERARARALERRVAACDLAIRELRNSTSWRLTAPLRAAAFGFGRLARRLRRGAAASARPSLHPKGK